ncbi:MAG: hypothetical protein ABSG77_16310 [Candidatus Acidiferrum sp.]|jgi:hypothetical protein
MNTSLLREHISNYLRNLQNDRKKHDDDLRERAQRKAFFQGWSADRMRTMGDEDIYDYVSQLWAMRIWSNKRYVVEKMIRENGIEKLKAELVNLIWGQDSVDARWDRFRNGVRHVGPAMMSELLCHAHPDTCMLWNRRAYVAYRYLNIAGLPRYDYQLTGKKYDQLSAYARDIGKEMRTLGATEVDLLTVDYFLWDELQVEDTLSQIHKKGPKTADDAGDVAEIEEVDKLDSETSQFVHNETKDKLAEIGRWLGFSTDTEVKVADGSVVDTVWEATIGNMGRVIYVFEVQTKGSIDSLILNLLKSMNNPAVQGVVAVSDSAQLERIKKHASAVKGLGDKLKYWDYREVLKVYESLQAVYEAINKLGLVPQGF